MNQSDDEIRELVRRELYKVRPLYAENVSPAREYASYSDDFLSTSIKAMQRYQNAHRWVFCKSCIVPGPKDRLSYRRLLVELVPDLLGNDAEQVRTQCSRCDFDMYVIASPPLLEKKLDTEIEWNQLRAALSSATAAGCSLEYICGHIHRAAGEYHGRPPRNATRAIGAFAPWKGMGEDGRYHQQLQNSQIKVD